MSYDIQALGEAHRHMQKIEKAPLADRKEAQKDFLQAMAKEPDLVAERIGWLIDGNYGYGEMLQAKRVVAAPRSNRVAQLNQLVGAYEWQCPPRMAVDAWKKLTGAQKSMLEAAINIVIEEAEKEKE